MWLTTNIILALMAIGFVAWGHYQSKAVISADYSFMAFWLAF